VSYGEWAANLLADLLANLYRRKKDLNESLLRSEGSLYRDSTVEIYVQSKFIRRIIRKNPDPKKQAAPPIVPLGF
jgi:hypothetical protein